ncbi:TerC family protein [Cohnella candidum]|uniref:TerC family protein n=1 Tax=Cohnella candidum TaxID=2674991 RepID=A0A3G3JU78_9BACL|nr:TerC family protein [Cohnella candidum]AYQ71776.1 TerC family protein [Cohnella candidum]
MELLDRLFVFLEITLINLLLSGDNAVVIALAARRLPLPQRRKAVWWGAAAAVLLRCVLTLGAVAMLGVPFLQTAGALLLFGIALKLMLERGGHDTRTPSASSLAGAVWTIVAADFVMSLDNVLAVAAVADGDVAMLVIGIVMSIPIIIWGSSFIMRLLDRLPGLTYAGGALLAYTAGEMMLHDEGLARLIPAFAGEGQKSLPYVAAAVLLGAALVIRRTRNS